MFVFCWRAYGADETYPRSSIKHQKTSKSHRETFKQKGHIIVPHILQSLVPRLRWLGWQGFGMGSLSEQRAQMQGKEELYMYR